MKRGLPPGGKGMKCLVGRLFQVYNRLTLLGRLNSCLNRPSRNIDDILHKDAGCSSELDYVEQTSWVLFLKYLDDLEKEPEDGGRTERAKTYENIISPNTDGKSGRLPRTAMARSTTIRP